MKTYKFINQKIMIIFTLVLSWYSLLLSAQSLDDNGLEDIANKVIIAYNNKATDSINTYIHPSLGLYYLIKADNVEYWLQRQKICLEPNCIKQANLPAPYDQLLLEQQIEIKDEILIVDKKHLHKLTKTIRKFSNASNNLSNKQLRDIWRMESNSRRVIISSKGDIWGGNIAFYFTYFDNNWYLSIIDFNN